MKYKIAICKVTIIGSPALVLGICRYDETDEFWLKYQMYTCEDYLNTEYTYSPPDEDGVSTCMYRNQEECDKAAAKMRKFAQTRSKFQGEVVHFTSINKDVKVYHDGRHDFDLSLAEATELTKTELQLLQQEMNQDGWEAFDILDWGK